MYKAGHLNVISLESMPPTGEFVRPKRNLPDVEPFQVVPVSDDISNIISSRFAASDVKITSGAESWTYRVNDGNKPESGWLNDICKLEDSGESGWQLTVSHKQRHNFISASK